MRDLIQASKHSHYIQNLGNYKQIVLRKYVKKSHFKQLHKTRKTTVKYTIIMQYVSDEFLL